MNRTQPRPATVAQARARSGRLIDELRARSSEFDELVRRFGGSRLRVFDPVARGEETQAEDIDLLVDIPPGYGMCDRRLALDDARASLLGRSVDLLSSHEINRCMRDSILADAIQL